MPRQPKPYYREQTKSWYCSISGRQISLGKNREAAFERFHELMADKGQIKIELTTRYDLSQAWRDGPQANRRPAIFSRHRRYLKSFIDSIGSVCGPMLAQVGASLLSACVAQLRGRAFRSVRSLVRYDSQPQSPRSVRPPL